MVFNLRCDSKPWGSANICEAGAKALPAWTRSLDAHITASSTRSDRVDDWRLVEDTEIRGPRPEAASNNTDSIELGYGWADGAPRLKLFGCADFGELARVAVDVDHHCRGSQCFCGGVELGAQAVEDLVGRAPAQLFEEPFNDHALRALTQAAPVVGVVLQLGCGSDQFGCPVRFTFGVCVDDLAGRVGRWRSGRRGRRSPRGGCAARLVLRRQRFQLTE